MRNDKRMSIIEDMEEAQSSADKTKLKTPISFTSKLIKRLVEFWLKKDQKESLDKKEWPKSHKAKVMN